MRLLCTHWAFRTIFGVYMKHYHLRKTHALSCVAAFVLSACGGGGNTVVDAVMPPVAVVGTVADGLIQGAIVCYDINDNNKCDADEPKSTPTDAQGNYSISIPFSAAGKHAMIADIPATAIDSDKPGVAIGAPLTMMSPVQSDTSKPVFVSPLTTAVQEVMNASGNTDKEAAKAAAVAQVTQTLGLTVSPLTNYITPPAGTDPAAAAAAHNNAQVITEVKKEITTVAMAAGVAASDIPALTSQAIVNNLPAVATAVTNQGTQTPTQAATSVVTATGITPATVVTQTAIATGLATGTTTAAVNNTPYTSLRYFTYTDANNWNYRLFTGDGVADANGVKYSNEVRKIMQAGVDKPYNRNTAYWDPANNKWFECASDGYKVIKFTDPVGTAPGTSLYCHSSSASTRRTTEDISGKTIASIVDKVRAAGLPDSATWAADSSKLASQTAVFPTDAKLSFVVGTDTDIPDQHSLSSKVKVTPAGESMTNPSSSFGNWPYANSLDDLLEHYFGDLTTVATTAINGAFSLEIAVVPDPTVTNINWQKSAFYQVGFKPNNATSGQARYYKCRRNDTAILQNTYMNSCEVLSTSTYAIETKADSRVLRLAGVPAAVTAFRKNTPIYVERAGAVLYGWTPIPTTTTSARLNKEAWDALRAQFAGVTAHTDPIAPVTAESGSWLRDLRELATGFSYRITNTIGATSGSGNEIRVTYNCGPNYASVGCPNPLPAADTFTRNRLFLVAGAWKDSDADGACPSNGVNLFSWTSNPRESVGCGGQTESHTGFDMDISGRTYTSVFGEGRAYGGRGYGADTRNWGDNPNAADNGTYKFPQGSKLRFQQSTIKTVSPSIGIWNGSGGASTGNKVVKWVYNSATQTSSNTDAATLDEMIAHHDGVATSVKTGPGNWSIQLYSYQEYGTPAAGTTGLKRYRASFTPTSATAGTVKYYSCDTQVTTNYSINCALDTTTTNYTISTLGGKRVLNFNFAANQIAGIRDERTFGEVFFAEHNGKVYYGNKDFVGSKHNTLRLNQTAYEDMLYSPTKWGLPVITQTPTAVQ
jgi:trimeric autotransporter adhesin